MGIEDEDDWFSEEMIEAISRELSGDQRPATVGQLAELYKVLAAQQEAVFRVFKFATRVAPKEIFTDDAQDAHQAFSRAINLFADAVSDLAPKEENGDG